MIVLVKGLSGTLVLDAAANDTGACLKRKIQDRARLPACQQILVFKGRQLKDEATCAEAGINPSCTLHLTFRLRGGKGGFGALLRGQGRDGKLTTNFDACRDLQGRRMRHVNAEQKLKEWNAQAKERELEKIALQHIKEQAKAAKKEQATQVDVDEVRQAHKQAVDRVKSAVEEALASAPSSSAPAALKSAVQSGKGKALLFGLEDLADSDDSDSDSEDNSDATCEGLPAKGKRKAATQADPTASKKVKPSEDADTSGSSD